MSMNPASEPTESKPPRPRSELPVTLTWAEVRRPLIRSAVGVGALVIAGLIGIWSADPSTPGDSSIEAGFARDMAVHHSQAIDMSFAIRDETSATDVRNLARSVITSEGGDVGEMNGWLQSWGLPQRSDGARMSWMRKTGHLHEGLPKGETLLPDGRMPGIASVPQVQQLTKLRGKPAEILYLQLMRIHEGAAIQMATAAESASNKTAVVQLAAADITRDQQQLKAIASMLALRKASPWTSAQAGQPVPRP